MTNFETAIKSRRSLLGVIGVSLLAPLTAVALGQGKGKGKGSGKGPVNKGGGQFAFSSAETTIIFGYVGENPGFVTREARRLPPGLAKNLQRGKPLPPGWAKKISPFPVVLDRRLPPLPAGYRRVVVDRWAFVIAEATNTVMDVIDLIRNP